jgi:hypothetical protein
MDKQFQKIVLTDTNIWEFEITYRTKISLELD